MRLGVIGGIHEDVVRLREALDLLERAGCHLIACVGDVVGYSVPYYGFLKSRDARASIALVRRHCRYVVAGNHDLFAVRKLPLVQRVFDYPPNWYELDWSSRRNFAADQVWLYDNELPALLTNEDEEYLRSLPEFIGATVGDLPILLSHYAYPDLTGDSTTFDSSDLERLKEHFGFMASHGCVLGISGHEGHDGVVLHAHDARVAHGFGVFDLPRDQPAWLQIPWVANGTYSNGVVVIDTVTRRIEGIALNSPRHIVPPWARR